MEAALIAKLLATTGITDLVSARINWSRRPQADARPSIVLFRISGQPDVHLSGGSGLVSSRVQADCWGDTYASAKACARALEAAVCSQSFVQDTIRFDVVLLDSERDDTFDDATTHLFRTSLDMIVHHAKAS